MAQSICGVGNGVLWDATGVQHAMGHMGAVGNGCHNFHAWSATAIAPPVTRYARHPRRLDNVLCSGSESALIDVSEQSAPGELCAQGMAA